MSKANPIEAKKTRYLNALLTSSNKKAAIKAAGISRATAQRYERDDEFKHTYHDLQRKAMEFTGNKLRSYATKAVDALGQVLDDPKANPTEKTRAAKIILDSAFHVQSNEDILARLDKLEAKIEGTS